MSKRDADYLGWLFYAIAAAGGVLAGIVAYLELGEMARAFHTGVVTGVTLAAVLLVVHLFWRLVLPDRDDRPNLRGTRYEHINRRTLAWQLEEFYGRFAFGQLNTVEWLVIAGFLSAAFAAAGFTTTGWAPPTGQFGGFLDQKWSAALLAAVSFAAAGIGLLLRLYRR